MIKIFKKITVIAFALVLLGAILFTTAFALSGFSFSNLSGVKINYQTFTEDDSLTANKLYLNFECTDIYLTFDEQAERISVTYPEKESKNQKLSTVTCSQKDGSISIVENESKKINLFLWDFTSRRAEVTIPKNRMLDLVIETDTGDVEIKGNSTLTSLSVETDTGDIDVSSTALTVQRNADFEADTGDVTINKIYAQNLNFEVDTGEITMKDCSATNNIKIDSDTGDVELVGIITCELIEIITDTGDIDAENAIVDAMTISTKTDTGDVKIKLAGKKSDYGWGFIYHDGGIFL